MTDSLAEHYLKDAVRVFRGQKKLADGAVAQVSDEEFFRTIDAESNSIAVIMKHMAGNMRSRWTDFLTSDGEKPDRRRDSEFEPEGEDRRDLDSRLRAERPERRADGLLAVAEVRAEADVSLRVLLARLCHLALSVPSAFDIIFALKASDAPRATLSVFQSADLRCLARKTICPVW